MERETGIEPVTSSLGSWRSTAELLPLNFVRLPFRPIQNNARKWLCLIDPGDEAGLLKRAILPESASAARQIGKKLPLKPVAG